MDYSGRGESANRNYNVNSFPGRSGSSTSRPGTLAFSTSDAQFYSASGQYDPYCKPTEYFQQRASNSFYGGNYQETHSSPAMNCPSQQQHRSGSTQDRHCRDKDPNSMDGNSRRLPKKKKRSGRGKKQIEEPDEDVHLKENGEWDADFHFFGVESPRSRTVRASELPELTQ